MTRRIRLGYCYLDPDRPGAFFVELERQEISTDDGYTRMKFPPIEIVSRLGWWMVRLGLKIARIGVKP